LFYVCIFICSSMLSNAAGMGTFGLTEAKRKEPLPFLLRGPFAPAQVCDADWRCTLVLGAVRQPRLVVVGRMVHLFKSTLFIPSTS
jgi:hypothetical protein